MKLGSSALQVRSVGISFRSLYRLIRGGQCRQPHSALPCLDLAEVDDGEGGHGWYLYARPDEEMDLAQGAAQEVRSLKLVQAGSKG